MGSFKEQERRSEGQGGTVGKMQLLKPDDLDSKSSLTIFHMPHAKKLTFS